MKASTFRFPAGPLVRLVVQLLVGAAVVVVVLFGSATRRGVSHAQPLTPVGMLSIEAAQWRDGGTATLNSATPPTSTMIAGANDLLTSGPATVFAATDEGIARSTDAGSSWRYVLTGAAFWSLTRAGSGFVALGRRGAPDQDGPAVLATSDDGVAWRLVDVSAPPQPMMPFGYGDRIAATGTDAHAVDVAVPDIVASSAGGTTMRSVDGGRTWTAIATKLDTGIDVLPDGTTMYATGRGNTESCSGAVYRSTDAGARWTLLPGSCQNRPLYAVAFVDADHGFAAGGTPAKYDGSDVVEATDDGGRTWQVRWSTPFDGTDGGGGGGGSDNQIIRLVFADPGHGYALTGGCVDGQNGPCGGNLYATSDAGHSWRLTGRSGLEVAAARTGIVYLSGAPQRAEPAMAVSVDGGENWSLHSDAEQVSSQSVTGSGQVLGWQTNIGTFTSNDAGAHWTRSSSPDAVSVARFSFPGVADDMAQAAALSPDGRTAAIVGFDDDCSSPQLIAKMAQVKPGWRPETRPATLYLSDDAGRRWERSFSVPFPFFSFGPGSLAVDAKLLVAFDACANLEVSVDSGRDWATIVPPHASSGCTVSLYDVEIWLDCLTSIAHSSDAGATWVTYATNPGGLEPFARPLDATGSGSAIISAAGSLWRTTDGGAHWTQTWADLPGES